MGRFGLFGVALVTSVVVSLGFLGPAASTASASVPEGSEIVVCGRGNGWAPILGNRMARLRTKLSNSDLFGPNGTILKETFKFVNLGWGAPTAKELTDQGCNIWISGYDNGWPFAALKDFTANGGFVIAGCDGALYDAACEGVDSKYAVTNHQNLPGSFVDFTSTSNPVNPMMCGIDPALRVATSGNESSYFNESAGTVLLRYLDEDTDGIDETYPLVITDSLTNPTILMTADIDMYTTLNSGLTADKTITTDQDKFLVNSFNFAVDALTGRLDSNGGTADSCDHFVAKGPSLSVENSGEYEDTNGNGKIDPGDRIVYTYKVTNTGGEDITNVTITDPKVTIQGGPIASMAPDDEDDSTFTGYIELTQADIDAGKVTAQSTATGQDTSSADVTDKSDDPDNSTNTDDNSDGEPDDPTVTNLSVQSAVSIEKKGEYVDKNGNGVVDVGDVIEYTYKVTNTGDTTLTGVEITDPGVTVTGQSVGNMNPGDEHTTATGEYAITAADIAAGAVTKQATATGTSPSGGAVTDESDDPDNLTNADPNGDDDPDDATTTTFPKAKPSIKLEKVGTFNDENGNGVAEPGETITYTYKIINDGNEDLTGVDVDDPGVVVTGGPIDLGADKDDLTSISGTYTITQTDIDAGQVEGQATVEGQTDAAVSVTDISDDPQNLSDTDVDGDGDPDDKTVTPLIASKPSILLTKKGTFNDENGNGVADPGETITYVYNVTNNGNVEILETNITDPGVVVTGGPIPSLGAGEADDKVIVGTYTITQADIDAGKVEGTATVRGVSNDGSMASVTDTSDDPDNLADNDTDGDGDPDDPTSVNLVGPKPAIEVEKTAVFQDENGNGRADPGETVIYVYKVKNTGNIDLTQVTITDPNVVVDGSPIAVLPVGESDGNSITGIQTITQADIDSGAIGGNATGTAVAAGTVIEVSDLSDDPTVYDDADTEGDGEPDDPTLISLPIPANDIRLEKTGQWIDENGNGFADPGEQIVYTYRVTNVGDTTLTDISIDDPGVDVAGDPIGRLEPGQSDLVTFEGVYVITEADIKAGGVTSTATANGLGAGGVTVSDASDDPNNLANVDSNGDGDPDDPTMIQLETQGLLALTGFSTWFAVFVATGLSMLGLLLHQGRKLDLGS